jgi:hypothetical protein
MNPCENWESYKGHVMAEHWTKGRLPTPAQKEKLEGYTLLGMAGWGSGSILVQSPNGEKYTIELNGYVSSVPPDQKPVCSL